MKPAIAPYTNPDEYITLADAARETGLSRSSLNSLCRMGKIPFERRHDPTLRYGTGGIVIVFTRRDLDLYLYLRGSTPQGKPKPLRATYIPSMPRSEAVALAKARAQCCTDSDPTR